ncbi:MAG TPA: DUF1186 domain-containing protein [Bacillota bacterium]|nr:DUF1186 domain-containing protein [Bacillota bacterium]
MNETENSYHPPADQLLALGKPEGTQDYLALGIGADQVPELVRMVTDEALNNGPGDSLLVWAPVHAWRALAQLRAEAAIQPLLSQLRRIDESDDDWVNEDVPRALGKIGPAAIAPVADYLANAAHGTWARVAAVISLQRIAETYPESRAECVARLIAQLERFEENSDSLNAFLVWALVDLKAVEAAPLIEKAFAAAQVDETVGGDWEDAQIELGLKSAREHPRKPNQLPEWGDQFRAALQKITAPVQGSLGTPSPYPDLKALNKARKQARSRDKKAKKAKLLQRQRRH